MTPDVVAELEALREAAGGLLLPAAVVEYARDPTSAMHNHFEWDDGAAAELHRLSQARAVIRAVIRIMPAGNRGPTEVRAYVSVQKDRVSGGGYRSIDDVLSDEAMAASAAAEIEQAIGRLRVRFAAFAALRPTLDALGEALGHLPGAA